jgi:hypothetical protein
MYLVIANACTNHIKSVKKNTPMSDPFSSRLAQYNPSAPFAIQHHYGKLPNYTQNTVKQFEHSSMSTMITNLTKNIVSLLER